MSLKYFTPYIYNLNKTKFVTTSIINNFTLQSRYSSYQTSKKVGNIDEYTSNFEISKNPDDWKYVERLLPKSLVPTPTQKPEYTSGWKPPTDLTGNGSYFVARSKNFMVPVYLYTSHRGMRKITKIRRIQGDAFQLEKDLKNHLEEVSGREVATQVNELVGYIHIKGDFVNVVKNYLVQKGF